MCCCTQVVSSQVRSTAAIKKRLFDDAPDKWQASCVFLLLLFIGRQGFSWHGEQVHAGRLWTFEQEQSLAFTNVATTVRMAVVKLRTGGLLLFSAIAPTE